jgi:hypothetical protein
MARAVGSDAVHLSQERIEAEDAGRFANRAAALNSMALGVINGASYIDEVDWNEGSAVSE